MQCALGLLAAPVTPQEALQRLGGNTRGGADAAALRLAFTTRQADGEPAVYIFNNTAAGGYLLLSADDSAAPMLGYSDSGKFVESEMSPELIWWLGEYARQIEYGKTHGADSYIPVSTRADRKAIAPMVTTLWNQDEPYNGMTPIVDGKHCVTGCVATSTAQVMNFWKYPEVGKGVGQCTVTVSDEDSFEDEMDFSERKFDWANMLDVYTSSATQAQKDAVAYLMKACGYGVDMNYSSGESGAASIYVARALINNFGYNPNIQYCERDYYSPADWDEMVYGELAAGRPIVYGGQSQIGGHSFVCDGYSADGYYHFNWGWGGMSNGYFLLNALDPMSLGIGANGGGYNFGQDMVRGIQKEKSAALGASMVITGALKGSSNSNRLTLIVEGTDAGIYNYDGKTVTVSLGVMIEPLAGGNATYAEISGLQNQTLDVLYGWKNPSMTTVISNSLPDGDYRVTLCYKQLGSDVWMPMGCSNTNYNYVNITKKGSRITVKSNPKVAIKLSDAKLLSELYYGQVARISVTVDNPSDRALTKSVYPVLYSGADPVMVAQGATVDLAAGESKTVEFDCVFSLLSGVKAPSASTDYTLRFYDPAEGRGSIVFYPNCSVKVTMNVGKPKITASDFTMPGLEYSNNIYQVTDPEKLPFSVKLKNSGSLFSNRVSIYVYVPAGGNKLKLHTQLPFPDLVTVAGGEVKTLEAVMSLPSLEDGTYVAFLFSDDFIVDASGNDISLVFSIDTSGIDNIGADNGFSLTYNKLTGSVKAAADSSVESMTVWTLDGREQNAPAVYGGSSAEADLSGLPAGIYVVKATASDGKTRTLKIVR